MKPVDFFTRGYVALRPEHGTPMKWMQRMFQSIIQGNPPFLVNLETGAGKTELVVIWLLALAWFGKNRHSGSPVPRRLVWIINRRVLVQQVFRIASNLQERLMSSEDSGLNEIRTALIALSGAGEILKIVELRGQIVPDKDWAIRPTVPQLIIGTVDQLGSRLLFQGYGLGKWGRPQQAGLLGVDAWIVVDEAHLIPAFVLTLRQLRERCGSLLEEPPAPLDEVFARLPFWLTELSATPGLPLPSDAKIFSLTEDERTDELIRDRVLAATTRQIRVNELPKSDKLKDTLVENLVKSAIASKAQRVAVFVREVAVADKVAAGIKAELKKTSIKADCICKVTGRIRGYERDRLVEQKAFKAFLWPRDNESNDRWFLVGTAAAEVGLDADADAIFCDFASLPTLLQRLGRLDRRGVLSRRYVNGTGGEPPTMVIFTPPEMKDANVRGKIAGLAAALKADSSPYSAELMAGSHWFTAIKAKDENAGDAAKETKSIKNITDPLIETATWSVLRPKGKDCTPPKDWLTHENACITSGPVVVPPITDALLDYWSATTEARSPCLSPHPFLYGLMDDNEGTPLVGVAFRLEVEALRETLDEEDIEGSDSETDLVEVFKHFPPLRAELHQIKLATVIEWLTSAEAQKNPLIYRSHDQWHVKPAGEPATATASALGPNGTLILPASVLIRDACKELLKDSAEREAEEKDTAISDVLDGVIGSHKGRYLRTIDPPDRRIGGDGAWRWNNDEHSQVPLPSINISGFKESLRKKFRIGSTEYIFRYYRPHKQNEHLQYLDDYDSTPGHIVRAEREAGRLAEAIAPGNNFLSSLLSAAAHHHDEGKRYPKWQRAFGWRNGMRELAKLHPDLKQPAPLNGFRHEWESLRQLVATDTTPPPDLPLQTHALWRDLLLHLVGVHHGHLRPSIADDGLTPTTEAEKQNPLRLEAAKRFARLQRLLGRWRLAYLEALLKTADAEGSRIIPEDEDDAN
jgi:CRISPR-associated endonuclease/helicase Cas3